MLETCLLFVFFCERKSRTRKEREREDGRRLSWAHTYKKKEKKKEEHEVLPPCARRAGIKGKDAEKAMNQGFPALETAPGELLILPG